MFASSQSQSDSSKNSSSMHRMSLAAEPDAVISLCQAWWTLQAQVVSTSPVHDGNTPHPTFPDLLPWCTYSASSIELFVTIRDDLLDLSSPHISASLNSQSTMSPSTPQPNAMSYISRASALTQVLPSLSSASQSSSLLMHLPAESRLMVLRDLLVLDTPIASREWYDEPEPLRIGRRKQAHRRARDARGRFVSVSLNCAWSLSRISSTFR